MGTIAQELTRLQTAKADIKTAIEGKGVTVPSATTIDGYASLIGQISQGVQEAEENDVNFYDYDGFRVASFTIAEAKALTQAEYNAILPPTHEGLTFQEWNWTLSDITSYNRRYIDIGANYITTDGKTYIKGYVSSVAEDVIMSFNGQYGTLEIDWGDESTPDTYTFTSAADYSYTHTYSATGNYTVKCTFTQSSNNGKFGPTQHNQVNRWSRNFFIEEFNCGSYFTIEKTNAFSSITNRFILSIPTSAYISVYQGFNNSFPEIVTIPRNVSVLSSYNGFMRIMGKISLPKVVPDVATASFQRFCGTRLVVPECSDNTQTYNKYGFMDCSYMDVLSIPLGFDIGQNTIFSTSNFYYLDIVQGWVPNASFRLDYCSSFGIEGCVDFFNKLGTTNDTITITLSGVLLNTLTSSQKAIATDKGYTLASV